MSSAQKLEIIPTIKEGIGIGIKNIGPILVNILLWVLTVWIPYLNVGTTIGLSVGIVTKASRGEVIPMTEIFDPKYRKYMGEYFLTSGLIFLGVLIGTIFGIIPGMVIGFAWCLAILLVIDKGKNPAEALTLSNNCTYGYKWRIFGVYFLIWLAFFVVIVVLSGIFAAISGSGDSFGYGGYGYDGGPAMSLMPIIMLIIMIFATFIIIGVQASIYKQLTEDI